ncbi:peroxidase 29 [Cornus florida]|uniref:peroxidase 29 n=1 Tax=Cornus florida TaxID=4283 RepID=UPI00289DDF1E|nr:peroxidase 29 [Cornus florida]
MYLRTIVALILVFEVWFNVEGGGVGLSYDFYESSCPQVEDIVRTGLQSLSATDPTSPAAMLRLMFHDCQVQGCDASILLDPSNLTVPLEMTSKKNYGIRKRELISTIKLMVETVCPQQVSCADILILAAREAVALSGGPLIRVPLGRRDSSTTSSYKFADASLPAPNLGVDGMLLMFSNKGMTTEEAVAITGAHTLGVTHCFNILNRLYSPEIGHTQNMEPGFELLLRLSCPLESSTSNTSIVLNDPTTLLFDNQYYINAMRGRGVLRIDAEMSSDPRTARFVELFAVDEDEFFRAFSSAFVKLSSSGVLTGSQGVIRKSCDALN